VGQDDDDALGGASDVPWRPCWEPREWMGVAAPCADMGGEGVRGGWPITLFDTSWLPAQQCGVALGVCARGLVRGATNGATGHRQREALADAGMHEQDAGCRPCLCRCLILFIILRVTNTHALQHHADCVCCHSFQMLFVSSLPAQQLYLYANQGSVCCAWCRGRAALLPSSAVAIGVQGWPQCVVCRAQWCYSTIRDSKCNSKHYVVGNWLLHWLIKSIADVL
jgi:hypothetical protein